MSTQFLNVPLELLALNRHSILSTTMLGWLRRSEKSVYNIVLTLLQSMNKAKLEPLHFFIIISESLTYFESDGHQVKSTHYLEVPTYTTILAYTILQPILTLGLSFLTSHKSRIRLHYSTEQEQDHCCCIPYKEKYLHYEPKPAQK